MKNLPIGTRIRLKPGNMRFNFGVGSGWDSATELIMFDYLAQDIQEIDDFDHESEPMYCIDLNHTDTGSIEYDDDNFWIFTDEIDIRSDKLDLI